MQIHWEMFAENTLNIFGGLTDDGSWREMKVYVEKHKLKIIKVKLFSIIESTDYLYADGYLITNKLITSLENNTRQLELVGLGGWNKSNDNVDINWYIKNTLQLVEQEKRPLDKCEAFLIKNP